MVLKRQKSSLRIRGRASLRCKELTINDSLILFFRDAYVFRLEWNDWVHTNALFVLDIAIVLVGGLVVLILTGLHTYLACTNQSTWELVSRHRITYLKHIGKQSVLYKICLIEDLSTCKHKH